MPLSERVKRLHSWISMSTGATRTRRALQEDSGGIRSRGDEGNDSGSPMGAGMRMQKTKTKTEGKDAGSRIKSGMTEGGGSAIRWGGYNYKR